MFIWKEDLVWRTILFNYTGNEKDEIFKFETYIAQKNLHLLTYSRKEKMHTNGIWFYYGKNQKNILFIMFYGFYDFQISHTIEKKGKEYNRQISCCADKDLERKIEREIYDLTIFNDIWKEK